MADGSVDGRLGGETLGERAAATGRRHRAASSCRPVSILIARAARQDEGGDDGGESTSRQARAPAHLRLSLFSSTPVLPLSAVRS